ncbi:MAG: alpha/beta hydrolase [Chloroflexi bacterium CFX4]|nr:alpha/beta hydrolase [Chloroflexi bacterium CFX4]MDL1922544.1 alpha/beta hydrolase [Chloroflexi bacterium CFX3]
MSETIPRPLLLPADFQGEMITTERLRMHVVQEGEEGAPLVVLLHGFPELWYSWRWQIKALAAAGFRVAAPDLRGYNLTERRPPYDPFTLTKDVVNLIRALGYEQAHVVGHDWGGLIAWLVGALYPEVVNKLTILNVPHPSVVSEVLRRLFLKQIGRSWYAFFFQLPRLPERALARNNFRALAGGLRRGTPNGISKAELNVFREAWAQEGSLSAALNYYRQFFRHARALLRRDLTIRVPTRLIWGEPDFALTKETAEWSRRYVRDGLQIDYIPNSGHFVQQDQPERVNELLIAWLRDA